MNPPHELPAFLARLTLDEADSRPSPSLGLGDQEAASALLAATRAVLSAAGETDIIIAVARFGLDMGGRMVPAALGTGSAIPLDITLGAESPVLFDADDFSLARMRLEQFLPMLVEDARTAISRLRQLEDVQRSSSTDPLTGLLSRRELMRRLPGLQVGDVVCLVDIDNFKAINQRDGHVGGDLVLRDLGRLVLATFRGGDCAGRYGGDEIVILLRGMSEAVAMERLELLQQLWAEGAAQSVTFSGGAAALDDRGWEAALANAVAAMHAAKQQSRNRSRGHDGVSA